MKRSDALILVLLAFVLTIVFLPKIEVPISVDVDKDNNTRQEEPSSVVETPTPTSVESATSPPVIVVKSGWENQYFTGHDGSVTVVHGSPGLMWKPLAAMSPEEQAELAERTMAELESESFDPSRCILAPPTPELLQSPAQQEAQRELARRYGLTIPSNYWSRQR